MLLDQAREQAATLIAARADEVVFTSSGTIAVHTGMLGALDGRRHTGRHLVVSAVEHSSVLAVADRHRLDGGDLSTVPTDETGQVSSAEFIAALRPGTALACLQTANHEVGTLQPVGAVAQGCRSAGVPLLVDAAQSLGWAAPEPGWSLLAASAHKWGGPAGVGLLVIRTGTRWRSPWPADQRGSGRWPGFEDVPGAVAAVTALAAARASADADAIRLSSLVDQIRREVPERVPGVEVVGHPTERLPHVVTFSCLYADGETLLAELDREGFAVSSGSSCGSSTLQPSHVLAAMGALTSGSIRVSLPRTAARGDVEHFLAILPDVVARVRALLGSDDL